MKLRFLTIIVALCAFASLDADAQSMRPGRPGRPGHAHSGADAFRGIGLTFGYVNSNYRTLDLATDEATTSGLLHGFTLGLTKDFSLLPHALYFQTGLNYIYQNDPRNENYKIPLTDMSVRLVGDREEHHLGIPLRLKYDLHLLDRVGLTFDAGPTLLMGLSSKYQYKTKLADSVLAVDYNLYNQKITASGSSSLFDLEDWMAKSEMYPEGRLGRFDVMLGASIGAHFFHVLEVRVGYDWGLINRYRKDIADLYTMRRGQFTLSAGIRF